MLGIVVGQAPGRYRRVVEESTNPLRRPVNLLRAALVLFLLALLFGPYWLRAAVPVWLPFLALAGLELHFFVGAIRAAPPAPPDRGPQPVDKELYGYPAFDEGEDFDDDDDYEEDEATAEQEPFAA